MMGLGIFEILILGGVGLVGLAVLVGIILAIARSTGGSNRSD
jgi:hypothetical protein